MNPKVFLIDPDLLFNTEGPLLKNTHLEKWQYYDKTEIGMNNYLQVLTSIAIYGFKYAVPITKGYRVMDGNFRTYSAKELGILLPVVFVRNNSL